MTRQGHAAAGLKLPLSSDLKVRSNGARIKHRLGPNSIKLYDKAYDERGRRAASRDYHLSSQVLPRVSPHRGPQLGVDLAAAFANPGFRVWGNGGRNILSGPGTEQLDLSLFKSFAIKEDKRLQFRAEFFNVSNTPQFNLPNSTIGSPNSGRITSAGSGATLQRTERQLQFALKLMF